MASFGALEGHVLLGKILTCHEISMWQIQLGTYSTSQIFLTAKASRHSPVTECWVDFNSRCQRITYRASAKNPKTSLLLASSIDLMPEMRGTRELGP